MTCILTLPIPISGEVKYGKVVGLIALGLCRYLDIRRTWLWLCANSWYQYLSYHM